jgi:hypothetical protein
MGLGQAAADFIVVSGAETIALPAGTGRNRFSTVLKCLRGRGAGIFGMPDLRPIHPQLLISKQPDTKDPDGPKCPVNRYYPGRNVSVQFGLLPPSNSAAPETRTRIILRFDVGGVGERAGSPILDDPRFEKLQGPAVFVLAAGEAASEGQMTSGLGGLPVHRDSLQS